jgi:hypothetical protein
MEQARLGAAFRELTTLVLDPGVLAIKFPRPAIALCEQRFDPFTPMLGLLGGAARIMGYDEAQAVPCKLPRDFPDGSLAVGLMEMFEQGDELVVAPPRYGEYKFERLSALRSPL